MTPPRHSYRGSQVQDRATAIAGNNTMKIWGSFYFGVLASCYSVSAAGAPMDPAGQELSSTPIRALTSPGLLSAVEENSRLAAHGNDRHYTNLTFPAAGQGSNSAGIFSLAARDEQL